MTTTTALDYRPEIDGLRALAVFIVVLFHLDVGAVGGGYVGVDVFFVISGYLITRIVFRDIASERFSLSGFYARRIRRLFPALVATLAATLVVGLVVLNPVSLVATALDTLYATISLANVRYLLTSDYFDEAAGLAPLLHTWSLSVEEQFYLLWPGLMWLVGKHPRRLVGVVALLSVAALCAGELMLERHPAAGFYAMPFRIWELGLGALLVWVPRSDGVTRVVRELTLVAGLCAIAYAALLYNRHTTFPGLAALTPCVGAAACIWAGDTPVVGAVLRNRVVVGLGKLSYSLYLVHWPLIVYARHVVARELSPFDRTVLLAASLGLALLLHVHVERRFRYRSNTSRGNRFAVGAACFTLLVCTLAHFVRVEDGLPDRYPRAFRRLLVEGDRVTPAEAAAWREPPCFLNSGKGHTFAQFDAAVCLHIDARRDNVLLFGDSAAAQLYHGLHEVHGGTINILQATAASCRGDRIAHDATCRDLWSYMLSDWVPQNGAKLSAIWFAARWDEPTILPWIEEQIAELRGRGRRVVLVGPPVDHDIPPAAWIASRYGPLRAALQPNEDVAQLLVPRHNTSAHVPLLDHSLRELALRLDVSFLSLLDEQCDAAQCLATVGQGPQRRLLQRDRFHFTSEGSVWFASQLTRNQVLGR